MTSFSENGAIYSFSTENLEGLFQLLGNHSDTYNKILTVGGSGDQAIICAMAGAKDIINVDINKHAYYYGMLKFYALEYLSYKEFCQFFLRHPTQSFSLPLFNIIYSVLPLDVALFWQKHYNQQAGCLIRESDLFNNRYDKAEEKKYLCYYLRNEALYLQAQQAIKEINIHWHTESIDQFLQHSTDYYDVILLSNLADYSHQFYPENSVNDAHLEHFKNHFVIPSLEHLSDNGIVEVAYVFDSLNLHDSHLRNSFNLSEKRLALYTGQFNCDYREIAIKSAFSPLDKSYKNEDRLCLLKKKNHV